MAAAITLMRPAAPSSPITDPPIRRRVAVSRGAAPQMRTLPRPGRENPARMRSSVVFPDPLGPSSAHRSPGPTVQVTVTDTTGAPLSGKTVYAFNGTTYTGYSKVTDANGQGISGTPTFLIGKAQGDEVNGIILVGAKPYAEFDTILKEKAGK